MDIIKDLKGNIVNVEDKIKFLYCSEFGKPFKKEYIISKISKIDYKNKEVIMESGHSCRYNHFSKYEKEQLEEEKKYTLFYTIGGEKIFDE